MSSLLTQRAREAVKNGHVSNGNHLAKKQKEKETNIYNINVICEYKRIFRKVQK
jgi:hypothetical protein